MDGLWQVTLDSLEIRGYTEYCWLHPHEVKELTNERTAESAGSPPLPAKYGGGFLYKQRGGLAPVLYVLVWDEEPNEDVDNASRFERIVRAAASTGPD